MNTPITKQQLAMRYGVCLRTVTSWVAEGRIAHLKVGRVVKFTEAHIAKFEKDHTVKAVA